MDTKLGGLKLPRNTRENRRFLKSQNVETLTNILFSIFMYVCFQL